MRHRPAIARHFVHLLRHHVRPPQAVELRDRARLHLGPRHLRLVVLDVARRQVHDHLRSRASWSTWPGSRALRAPAGAWRRSPRSRSDCCRCDGTAACWSTGRCSATGCSRSSHTITCPSRSPSCCRRQTASRRGCSCRRAADRGRSASAFRRTTTCRVRIGPVTVKPKSYILSTFDPGWRSGLAASASGGTPQQQLLPQFGGDVVELQPLVRAVAHERAAKPVRARLRHHVVDEARRARSRRRRRRSDRPAART